MYYKQAQVAANWWIEQIKKQCNECNPTKVIFDGTNFVVIDNSFAESLEHFHSILTKEIQYYLEINSYISYTCYIIPNRTLSSMAKKSNIPTTYFPYQAEMAIFDRQVHVSLGGDSLTKLNLPTE